MYHFYRPIEIDTAIEQKEKNALMSEWWKKHIGLLIKYQMPEQAIKEAIYDKSVLEFRAGAKEFLNKMKEKNVPIIILSAGIGNYITMFLEKNGYNHSNIDVIANEIVFKNGIATGIKDKIIHSLNKNEVSYPFYVLDKIQNKNMILLLGDSISDIYMVEDKKRDQTIRVGFLNEKVEERLKAYQEVYDIVCTEHTSFEELLNVLAI